MMGVFIRGGNSVVVVAGASSADESLDGDGDVLRIVNNSNNETFVKAGVGAQTATSSDFCVPPKSVAFLAIDYADDTVAMVSPSGSSAVIVMRGSLR
jgi:hypothetical protein